MKPLFSSISKKAIMAVSGLSLCAFLFIHLLGNLTLLMREDGSFTLTPGGMETSDWFTWVAHHYVAIPALFHIMDVGILALILLHAVLGVTLWLQNRAARPVRYVKQRSEGGRTLFSATMPYTGVAFIGVFLAIHLANFRFGEQDNPSELYRLVEQVFGRCLWVSLYVGCMVGLFAHLSHGFQSAFQSLGFSHPRYTPWIKGLGTLYATLVGIGFAILPILYYLNGGDR